MTAIIGQRGRYLDSRCAALEEEEEEDSVTTVHLYFIKSIYKAQTLIEAILGKSRCNVPVTRAVLTSLAPQIEFSVFPILHVSPISMHEGQA